MTKTIDNKTALTKDKLTKESPDKDLIEEMLSQFEAMFAQEHHHHEHGCCNHNANEDDKKEG